MARKSTKKRTAAKPGAKDGGGKSGAPQELERVLAERRRLQITRATVRASSPGTAAAKKEIQALTTELEQLSARATELFKQAEG